MAKETTPLMRQYYEMKAKYPNTVLLFRMGDFFETFDDDAAITAKICGITLTKRNNGAATASPLAGFPHHQLDTYLPKLVKAGCRVAVCEQIEDPKKKTGSIVKRDVIEVVTPGVSLYDKLLDSNRNNYIASVYMKQNKGISVAAGIAICDITTGEFLVGEIPVDKIVEIIEVYSPSEVLYSKAQKSEVESILSKSSHTPAYTKLEEWIFEISFSRELLLRQFKTRSFKGFGVDDMTAGISAAGVVLHYISETQKTILPQIHSLRMLNLSDTMLLDYPTRRNLEILHTIEGEANGSLIRVLDKTLTPLGSRLLKKWLNQPLLHIDRINFRLNAVEYLVENSDMLDKLDALLRNIGDIERLITRISSNKASTREVIALVNSLERIPKIVELLNTASVAFASLSKRIQDVSDLVNSITTAMLAEPAVQFGNGNVFKGGYNSELDSYVKAKFSAKQWLQQFQDDERATSGIPSLKVSFNNVFGYYIEITKTHKDKVPSNYERKQTLANAERYTTPSLKEFEQKILNAEFKIQEIEVRLFNEIKMQVLQYIEQIQANAYVISVLDCLQSFANVSITNNYVKPTIDDSVVVEIEDGRHPVVEQMLPPGEKYTANSTHLDIQQAEQIHIITGPNMAGKSCYLRQVALIVLMGQIGCFVPAKKAHFGLVDRIFTRVGASDNITTGESTFLVEMQETAYILHNATNRSLILLDEVGRGTATYDGLSIAWAITEHIHNVLGAKTLFATHYHELGDMAGQYNGIANYRAEVVETSTKVIFTHKFSHGASDHSFGIYVGKMAGLPNDVIQRAEALMAGFEKEQVVTPIISTSKISVPKELHQAGDAQQLSIFEFRDDAIRDRLREIDENVLTPIDAMNILHELKSSI
ncbi:MAG: DNA mismatch repair protein MutS [Ignavibacteria bacterium]|jgi:DNA mismatch repair protein MutS|nr:DNA mismatch repair protein MutS [Ignavibacteria bacterium]